MGANRISAGELSLTRTTDVSQVLCLLRFEKLGHTCVDCDQYNTDIDQMVGDRVLSRVPTESQLENSTSHVQLMFRKVYVFTVV